MTVPTPPVSPWLAMLRQAVNNLGINQTALSKRSGVGSSVISTTLSGINTPEPENLRRIAEALHPPGHPDVDTIMEKFRAETDKWQDVLTHRQFRALVIGSLEDLNQQLVDMRKKLGIE